MGRNKKYGNITLKQEDRELLEKLAKSQTAEYRKVQRAKILLMSADGMLNSEIASSIGVHRNTVATFVTKYIAADLDYAINDPARSGKPGSISDEEKAWITNIACTKPKDNGLAEELWTYRSLQKYIRTQCGDAGYQGLSKISHNTVRMILESNGIKPNKMAYYLERKDPDFESKIRGIFTTSLQKVSKACKPRYLAACRLFRRMVGLANRGNIRHKYSLKSSTNSSKSICIFRH